MELSVPMAVCLVAAAFSLLCVILCLRLARRYRSAKRGAETDEELIAVLSGAVAAATGTPASGLRLVSIEPREGFTTPVWGHAERPARGQNTMIRG
jgi:hypothetical protein